MTDYDDGVQRYGRKGRPSHYDVIDDSAKRKDQAGHQGGKPSDVQGTKNLPKGGTGTEKGNKGTNK